jgi:hypothetical protein
MKPLLVLALGVCLLTCQKSDVIVQHWQVKRGLDTTTWSNSFFCYPGDFMGIDTVPEVYTHEPDTLYTLKGTIQVVARVQYGNLYIRKYLQFLKRID